MTEFTAHFHLPIPDFTQEPWHDEFETLCRAIDTMAFEALLSNASAWANDTDYAVGQIVIDDVTDGLLYVCAVAHTSPAFPTTFLTFRQANPSYWNPTVQLPQQRGTWTAGTIYFVGDFVVDNDRYAVCIVSHTSVNFNADVGAGKWSVLVDLTGVDVGINGLPEVSIAAAPTVNLGGTSASRILITGTGQTITSFGSTPEVFKIVRFAGTNTLTNNANISLLDSQNFSTRAGDALLLSSNGAGDWREISRLCAARDDSRGLVELATNAEAVTATDVTRALTPASGAAQFNSKFFPAGTKMVFQQTSAPTGWTKDIVHNDKAMRVVSGAASSGGNLAFTTVFGKTVTDNFTLTQANLPNVSLSVTIPAGEGSHGHNSAADLLEFNSGAAGGGVLYVSRSSGSLTATPIQNNTLPQIGPGNWVSLGGSGTAHQHGMDIRVQYVDFIVATKS